MTQAGTKTPVQPVPPSAEGGTNGPGVALVLIWLVALGVAALNMTGPLDLSERVVAVALTFAGAIVLTLLVLARRALAEMRARQDDMQTLLGDLRRDIAQLGPTDVGLSPVAQSRIDALAAAQEQTDTRMTLFLSRRGRSGDGPAPSGTAATEPTEPRLALGEANEPAPAPIASADLIRALHFPEDENDTEGFDALRKALADSRTAGLIRAAQDVLTHLSQDGIYMDDLRPDRARPEFWRAFAQGTRGPLIAPLGGIRDRSCLALTVARMRNNPDFKAAAHLFLREFDRVFAGFEKDADDAQIAALAETRSARAFMLLGRVNGVFSR